MRISWVDEICGLRVVVVVVGFKLNTNTRSTTFVKGLFVFGTFQIQLAAFVTIHSKSDRSKRPVCKLVATVK